MADKGRNTTPLSCEITELEKKKRRLDEEMKRVDADIARKRADLAKQEDFDKTLDTIRNLNMVDRHHDNPMDIVTHVTELHKTAKM